MSKLRVFALIDEEIDEISVNINGSRVVFTRETAQQDVEVTDNS